MPSVSAVYIPNMVDLLGKVASPVFRSLRSYILTSVSPTQVPDVPDPHDLKIIAINKSPADLTALGGVTALAIVSLATQRKITNTEVQI